MNGKRERQTKVRYETSVVDGALYFEDARQAAIDTPEFVEIIDHPTCTAIRVVSLKSGWYTTEYVTMDSKIKSDVKIEMTLRKETRRGKGYWYAYRRVLGVLHKRYVGMSENVTDANLLKIARALPGI